MCKPHENAINICNYFEGTMGFQLALPDVTGRKFSHVQNLCHSSKTLEILLTLKVLNF